MNNYLMQHMTAMSKRIATLEAVVVLLLRESTLPQEEKERLGAIMMLRHTRPAREVLDAEQSVG